MASRCPLLRRRAHYRRPPPTNRLRSQPLPASRLRRRQRGLPPCPLQRRAPFLGRGIVPFLRKKLLLLRPARYRPLVLGALGETGRAFVGRRRIGWSLLLTAVAWMLAASLQAYPAALDLCNLLFVILVEDAFLEMFPPPYLADGTIFGWRKLLWFLQFVAVTFFLFHTLLNPQGTIASIAQAPPAGAALWLLASYVAGVFLLWGGIAWTRGKKAGLPEGAAE